MERCMHWYVRCDHSALVLTYDYVVVVDGISRGHGSGKTKGTAKMIAAQNAYQVLGWTDGSA